MFQSLFIAVLLASPASAAPKRIGIIAFDGVLTSDVTAPAEVLGMALNLRKKSDWVVEIIGAHDRDWVTTAEGLRLGVNHRLKDAPNVDVLILPGSYDPAAALKLPGLKTYITAQSKGAERVASHCAGAFLLASTGVLDGRNVTTYPGGAATLAKAHPKLTALEGPTVVVDGNATTSNGSIISYEGAVVLVGQMFGDEVAQQVFEGVKLNRFIEWSRIKAHL